MALPRVLYQVNGTNSLRRVGAVQKSRGSRGEGMGSRPPYRTRTKNRVKLGSPPLRVGGKGSKKLQTLSYVVYGRPLIAAAYSFERVRDSSPYAFSFAGSRLAQ